MEVPLVYFYGHTTPSEHPELYKALVDRLADLLDRRARASPEVAALLHASKRDVELKPVKVNSTAQVGGAFWTHDVEHFSLQSKLIKRHLHGPHLSCASAHASMIVCNVHACF